MHPQMTRAPFLLVPLLLLVGHLPLAAQEWKANAISSVMHYRASVLGDTTAKFDGCRVGQHLGADAARPLIAEPVRRMLGPCDPSGDRYTVRVDSLSRAATDVGNVMVYLTVIRGEWVHREDFALVPHTGGWLMGVREARLWGAVQSYPRRPPTISPYR